MATTVPDAALLLAVLGGPAPAPLPGRVRVAGEEVLPDRELVATTYGAVFATEALATHRALGLWPDRADGYTPEVRAKVARAEAVELGDAPAGRERLREYMRRVLAAFDLVVSPVAASGPPRFDAGADLRNAVTTYLALQDLCGLPACALPDGRQVTGRPGEDALVLAYAAELART
jgi:Asp-tRNA(Asn)/Glu-tRNA(Gln) amidotransferase A subunit family amidase